MNSKSEICSKLTLLCVCLEFLPFVVAGKNLRSNDDNFINKANKNSLESLDDLLSVDRSLDICKNQPISAIEDLKRVADLYKSENQWSPWLDIPLLPIVYPTSPSLPDGPCKRQALRYLRALKNETLWATQIYDASTKYPDGIISGQTRYLGDFDACYNLKVTLHSYDNNPLIAEEEITGRYCLVDIEYQKKGLPPVDPLERHNLQFDPHGSVWEAIREKGDFRRLKRYILQMALCVPEVCTAEDIEAALKEPLAKAEETTNVQFNVSVKRHFCQALKDAPKLTRGAKIYCSIVVVLLSLVIVCTLYDYSLTDYKEYSDSLTNDLALCFSARRNMRTITKITSGHPGLDTIYLTRFLYLSFTIFGHRLIEYYAAPVVNISYGESLYTHRGSMIVLAGPQVIEGFFTIGGMLTSYNILSELDAKKKMDFFAAIITRFVRVTPSYALVVFFNIAVLPYIGSGPYWEWKIGLERDSCSSNWWTNLLYINNYVNPEKMCLFTTWYLSVDYQLYILALFVTYAFWRMPRKYGFTFLCLIIISGCIPPFVNTYFYNIQPVFKGLLTTREIRDDYFFTNHYVKTHERITSYFIGVLVGAVLNDHKRNPWQLSKAVTNILLAVFIMGFGVGSLLTADKYFDPNRNPGGLEAALHACLHRPAFALACSSVVILMTVGRDLTMTHRNLLAPQWVQPFAKITYGAYLVHAIIQLYDVGVTRIGRQFSVYKMFFNSVPDLVFSFSLALLLALTIEGPFRNFEKRLFRKKSPNKPSSEETQEVKKKY